MKTPKLEDFDPKPRQLASPLDDAPLIEKPKARKRSKPGIREKSREYSREHVREHSGMAAVNLPGGWPSTDEVEEFSFNLRKEAKVKVQSELPPQWQEELHQVALQLGVGRLELYRFIFGEFLGKVKRRNRQT